MQHADVDQRIDRVDLVDQLFPARDVGAECDAVAGQSAGRPVVFGVPRRDRRLAFFLRHSEEHIVPVFDRGQPAVTVVVLESGEELLGLVELTFVDHPLEDPVGDLPDRPQHRVGVEFGVVPSEFLEHRDRGAVLSVVCPSTGVVPQVLGAERPEAGATREVSDQHGEERVGAGEIPLLDPRPGLTF